MLPDRVSNPAPLTYESGALPASVFTAEAKAIDLGLDFIGNFTPSERFIIFTDSLSVLKALNHTF